jgi:hypothetical protein
MTNESKDQAMTGIVNLFSNQVNDHPWQQFMQVTAALAGKYTPTKING